MRVNFACVSNFDLSMRDEHERSLLYLELRTVPTKNRRFFVPKMTIARTIF